MTIRRNFCSWDGTFSDFRKNFRTKKETSNFPFHIISRRSQRLFFPTTCYLSFSHSFSQSTPSLFLPPFLFFLLSHTYLGIFILVCNRSSSTGAHVPYRILIGTYENDATEASVNIVRWPLAATSKTNKLISVCRVTFVLETDIRSLPRCWRMIRLAAVREKNFRNVSRGSIWRMDMCDLVQCYDF